jgi:hypothetical protein
MGTIQNFFFNITYVLIHYLIFLTSSMDLNFAYFCIFLCDATGLRIAWLTFLHRVNLIEYFLSTLFSELLPNLYYYAIKKLENIFISKIVRQKRP